MNDNYADNHDGTATQRIGGLSEMKVSERAQISEDLNEMCKFWVNTSIKSLSN